MVIIFVKSKYKFAIEKCVKWRAMLKACKIDYTLTFIVVSIKFLHKFRVPHAGMPTSQQFDRHH